MEKKAEKKAENSRFGLLWVDLEMTGLDSSHEVILEIAVVASDIQLTRMLEGPSLVLHAHENILNKMDQWCYEHHTASGLLAQVRQSTISMCEAEERVLSFVAEYCTDKRLLLAGNTVYQDRAFLRRYMPTLESKLYYRLIDVSSIKELVKAWYPHHPEADFKKTKQHRALGDVYESIAELRHYRKHFFVDQG